MEEEAFFCDFDYHYDMDYFEEDFNPYDDEIPYFEEDYYLEYVDYWDYDYSNYSYFY